MATTETFVPGRLYEMPLADLQPDPNQPRKYLDPAALDELTESVKQQNVVAPILFRVENGIAGERRCIVGSHAASGDETENSLVNRNEFLSHFSW